MSSSFHEFVLRGGQTVTAGRMNAFRRQIPFLKVKAETLSAGIKLVEQMDDVEVCLEASFIPGGVLT